MPKTLDGFYALIHTLKSLSSRLNALAALILLANNSAEDHNFLQQVNGLDASILVHNGRLMGMGVPAENIQSFNNLLESFSWTKRATTSTTPLRPQGSFARFKKALHAQIQPGQGTNVIILKKPPLKLSPEEQSAFGPELAAAFQLIETMPDKGPTVAAVAPRKRKAAAPRKGKAAAPRKKPETLNKKQKIAPGDNRTVTVSPIAEPSDDRTVTVSPIAEPSDDRTVTVSPTAGTLGTTNQHNAGQHSAGKGDAHLIKPATKQVKPLFPRFVNKKGPFDTEDTNMSSSEKGEFHPPLPPCDAPLGHAYDMSLGSEKDIRAFIKSL
jgi:hypothetical protein